jgi:hypothetical protein
VFYEKDDETVYAVKRPGISSYITGSGQAQGVFTYEGEVFTFSTADADRNWLGLTFGNGKYVAVTAGESSTIDVNTDAVYSTNGISWSSATLPFAANWGAMDFGGGLFVAVPYNNSSDAISDRAVSTPDGITWTERTLSAAAKYRGMCYGNSRWLAVGNDSNTPIGTTSTDGISWSNTGTLPTQQYYDCCWNGSVFIAITQGSACTSADTTSWGSLVSIGVRNYQHIAANTDTGRIIVASASQPRIAYSTNNGTSWTEVNLGITGGFAGIWWTGSTFVIISAANYRVYSSTDGTSWSAAGIFDTADNKIRWENMAINGSTFVFLTGSNKAAAPPNFIIGSRVVTTSLSSLSDTLLIVGGIQVT